MAYPAQFSSGHSMPRLCGGIDNVKAYMWCLDPLISIRRGNVQFSSYANESRQFAVAGVSAKPVVAMSVYGLRADFALRTKAHEGVYQT